MDLSGVVHVEDSEESGLEELQFIQGINAYGSASKSTNGDHREKLYVHNMTDERKAQETKMMHARQEQQNALEEAQVRFSFVLFFPL